MQMAPGQSSIRSREGRVHDELAAGTVTDSRSAISFQTRRFSGCNDMPGPNFGLAPSGGFVTASASSAAQARECVHASALLRPDLSATNANGSSSFASAMIHSVSNPTPGSSSGSSYWPGSDLIHGGAARSSAWPQAVQPWWNAPLTAWQSMRMQ